MGCTMGSKPSNPRGDPGRRQVGLTSITHLLGAVMANDVHGDAGSRAEVLADSHFRRRSRDSRHVRAGGLDLAALGEAYTDGLNERALQEAIELSKKVHLLGELPREKYEHNHHMELVECELCLEEYQDGDELLRMPCMHLFHSKCVGPWLLKSYTCPICNTDANQAIQSGVATG